MTTNGLGTMALTIEVKGKLGVYTKYHEEDLTRYKLESTNFQRRNLLETSVSLKAHTETNDTILFFYS